MSSPFDEHFCDDCKDKDTCSHRGDPLEHLGIKVINSSGSIHRFRNTLYRELMKRGIFMESIKLKRQTPENCDMDCENCISLDACSRPYDAVKKAEELLKKPIGKKMNLIWRD